MKKNKENAIEKMFRRTSLGRAFVQIGKDGDPVLDIRLNATGEAVLKKIKEMGYEPEFKVHYKVIEK